MTGVLAAYPEVVDGSLDPTTFVSSIPGDTPQVFVLYLLGAGVNGAIDSTWTDTDSGATFQHTTAPLAYPGSGPNWEWDSSNVAGGWLAPGNYTVVFTFEPTGETATVPFTITAVPGESSPPTATPTASASIPASPSPAADCTTFQRMPAEVVEPGTTLHLVESGCSVGIASIELTANGASLRTVTFTPPLPGGSVDVASTQAAWAGSGGFEGKSDLTASGSSVTLDETGTYQGSASVLSQHVGGSAGEWASAATASSEYGTSDWTAAQAVGPPDSFTYGDDKTAWAPSTEDGGPEWLELTYPTPLIPAAVDVWENNGVGDVTSVEAMDDASGTWTTLWAGTDPTQPGIVSAFSPPLTPTSGPVDRIRVTIDTSVPSWNEIDAVELLGPAQAPGWIVWANGSWTETGTVNECSAGACVSRPWTGDTARHWMWAFNSASGAVGATPQDVP